jgi:hypothetical protein
MPYVLQKISWFHHGLLSMKNHDKSGRSTWNQLTRGELLRCRPDTEAWKKV